MHQRRINRPHLQFDMAGVGKFFRQRDLVPVKFRLAHVDGHLQFAGTRLPTRKPPLVSMVAEVAALLSHHNVGDAARGIAAAFNFTTFSIPDPHAHIGKRRFFHDNQLVTTNARVAIGDGAGLFFGNRDRPFTRINDNEVIAEAVHFAKCDWVEG